MATTNLGLDIINQSENISPEKINQNMERLDALGVDYVTDQGKSGDWRYRRWKSGTYECWCRLTQQWATPSSGSQRAYTKNYPVTFAEYPQAFYEVRQDGNPGVHIGYVEHNATYAQCYVLGMMSSGADLELSIYAIGRVS